jgi:hypothetical protein
LSGRGDAFRAVECAKRVVMPVERLNAESASALVRPLEELADESELDPEQFAETIETYDDDADEPPPMVQYDTGVEMLRAVAATAHEDKPSSSSR